MERKNKMRYIKTGKILPEAIGHKEGVYFDVDDSGASLIVYFNSPTDEELAQFREGHKFEIRYIELQNIIMFTVKIGNLNWMDSPYSPHLSKNLTRLTAPEDGQGLALTLILIDSYTGTVKNVRLLGLSTSFTQKLLKDLVLQLEKPFDKSVYLTALNRIYQRYTTNQISKLSNIYCKIN